MKNVLITGANSYIGDNVKAYLDSSLDLYNVTIKDTINWTPDPSDFKDYDVVFNVAGIAHIKETKENRNLYYDVNRDLAISIAKAAKEGGVKQFILLSSMSVYGMTAGCIKKDTKPNPVNDYGKSKLQADRAIKKLSDESFRFVCLRPPMVYGKGCKGNYQILRSFALKCPVFPKIENQRSMIYIDNLCEFVKEVIDKERKGLFFPQNAEYVNTSEMVKLVGLTNGHKVRLMKIFNPFVLFVMKTPIKLFENVSKIFGNLTYEMIDAGKNDGAISKYTFVDSIALTENQIT